MKHLNYVLQLTAGLINNDSRQQTQDKRHCMLQQTMCPF